ncbi:MAG: nucleotidyltransferase family protein, partial [Candidatus Methylarchaceae archaeon HK01B]|nr:nucleotidyltransferase family protein [Candidatus Methylarchaceae archaeon HK01B]
GLRLRPLTNNKPKAMVSINGKPLAEIQLSWLKGNIKVERVMFSCGHKGEILKEHFEHEYEGVPIIYVIEKEPLGTGGAIKNTLRSLDLDKDEDILIMNGDVITNMDLCNMIEWHRFTQTMVTMLVVPYRSPFGVVHIDKLRNVRKFEEKPEFKDVWINGGIYLVQAKKLMKFLPDKGDIERETFPKLVDYGEISAFPYYGFWRVVDSIKDLKEVEKEIIKVESSLFEKI